MSHRAMNWALEQRELKPSPWRVLVMLADRHNKDTLRCDPDQRTLAEDCNMTRETVGRHISDLEEMGLIRCIERRDPTTRKRLTNFYILGLDFADPPAVEFAVPRQNESHVENSDMESMCQNERKPCDDFDGSHVTTVRHRDKAEPVIEPVIEPSAPEHENIPIELKNRTACILSGKQFMCSSISAVKARELIDIGLVSAEQCRAVGIYV